MFKPLLRFISTNTYVFIGILVGLYLSSLISYEVEYECPKEENKVRHLLNENENAVTSHITGEAIKKIPPKKVNNATEKKTKLIRPRYYSTELGIRQKMFVGVFTSEEKVNTQAVHINATIGHLVDKIKFFVTAQYKLKTKYNLTGLVGFTDTRHKYRPFQIIKYVGDSFGLDYDYYFFINDFTYVNVRKLKDIIGKISVSMDVYMGNKVEDSSFCNLDSGILLSNSVLKSMREHLDWCVINAVSDDHSENIGRCVFHSIGLSCDEEMQEQKVPTFKLKHFEVSQHLLDLSKRSDFNRAVTVYPILQSDDFYLLNTYFLKRRLEYIKQEIDRLSEDLTENWPPAQKVGAKPATRHDVPRQVYFNSTHMFFPDDFTSIRRHTDAEMKDIENMLEEVKSKVIYDYPDSFIYRRLINGYRTFDLSRGMEYFMDVGFRDLSTGKEVIKRFEIVKPLGRVELIQVPYVTENSRVTILLPVEETHVAQAQEFLDSYISLMNRKEKTFLMLVLLYQYNTTSKGKDDVYNGLKDIATKLSNKFKNDDNRIAWVSIRLPKSDDMVTLVKYKVLNFALVDLALKKIGLESLVLVLDAYSNISADFLNRVRMNTIANFQVFSPIPFRYYNPKVSQVYSPDITKNVGHFDRETYKYVSFYGKDYVIARKKMQHIPIIRVDEDIPNVLKEDTKNNGNVLEMFLKYGNDLHCMRATEIGLKLRYHEEDDPNQSNLFLGNEAQLAKLLLNKEEQIFK